MKLIVDKRSSDKMYVDTDIQDVAKSDSILSLIDENAILNNKIHNNTRNAYNAIKTLMIANIAYIYDLNRSEKELLNIIYQHYYDRTIHGYRIDINTNTACNNAANHYDKSKRVYQLAIDSLSKCGIISVDKHNNISLNAKYNFIGKDINDKKYIVISL